MAEGGGYVLEIDPGGPYCVADESDEPIAVASGRCAAARTSRCPSSAGSTERSKDDRLVLGAVEQVNPGTRALRSTVQENTCGAAWATAVWILVRHEGS